MRQSHFDVVDEHDEPTGQSATFDEVHSQGLWHRGVHVIIYTPDKRILMQKRAVSLAFHPGEIEVSVGGGVDAGESAEQAAIREVLEETGIKLKKRELHFIGKVKYNYRTRRGASRVIQYSYSACLPMERIHLTANPEETQELFFISKRRLRLSLATHSIARFGRISSRYAYWRYLLDAI